MPATPSPADLLTRALTTDPARPFLTFYDDSTGERVELSVITFENWVAKTANLIQDELALEPGSRVAILLPPHWQGQVWLQACWAAGVVPVVGADALAAVADCEVAVADLDSVETARACPGERVALSLRPLGAPLTEPVPGFLDYAAAVRVHGDRFDACQPVTADSPALYAKGRAWNGGEVVGYVERLIADEEWGAGSRVLTTSDLGTARTVATGLLAPLSVDGSIVLCRHLDQAGLDRRIAAERVTRVTETT